MKEKLKKIIGLLFNKKWKIFTWIISVIFIISVVAIYNTKWVRDINSFVKVLENNDYECTGNKSGNPFFNDSYLCELEDNGVIKRFNISQNTNTAMFANYSVNDNGNRFVLSHYDTLIEERVLLYSKTNDDLQVCMFEHDYDDKFDVYYVEPSYDCKSRVDNVIEYYEEFLELYEDAGLDNYLER